MAFFTELISDSYISAMIVGLIKVLKESMPHIKCSGNFLSRKIHTVFCQCHKKAQRCCVITNSLSVLNLRRMNKTVAWLHIIHRKRMCELWKRPNQRMITS